MAEALDLEATFKPIITRWGGKSQLVKHLLPLVPAHKRRGDLFCGGATLSLALPACDFEIINDADGALMNFFRQFATNFDALLPHVNGCLHCRNTFETAKAIVKQPWQGQEVLHAWAFWYINTVSILGKGTGLLTTDRAPGALFNKKERFQQALSSRFSRMILENKDALELLLPHDDPEMFYFLDPPYVDTDKGNYKGKYGKPEFQRLLDILPSLKAKVMLCGFESEQLSSFMAANPNWHQVRIEKHCCAGTFTDAGKRTKVEVITMNYPPPNQETGLDFG
jgi:DNA adenine methylase